MGNRKTIVAPEDIVARFVFDKKAISNGAVKYRAFLPAPQTNDTSVSVVTGLREAVIWRLAPRRNGRDARARAELSIGDVQSVAPLMVKRDDCPKYHGNIKCWPTDGAKRKALAQSLASKAKTIIK